MQIKDLLRRDLSERIEEVVKLNQTDEETVYTELTEYVATERIRDHYRTVLRAILQAPAEPHEGIGVWISGFFGSGKSSFAKNLGYVLENRTVRDTMQQISSSSSFRMRRLPDWSISSPSPFPTKVVMFDVSVSTVVRLGTERMAEIMYRELLQALDYAQDYTIAELEFELEKEGNLEDFMRRCQEQYGLPWSTVRKGAQRTNVPAPFCI